MEWLVKTIYIREYNKGHSGINDKFRYLDCRPYSASKNSDFYTFMIKYRISDDDE